MLNFNSKLLVDMRLLLCARERYMMGVPLKSVFEEIARAPTNNRDWVKANPGLSQR